MKATPVTKSDQFLLANAKNALLWMRANPKPMLIGVACGLAFNFVLYPIMYSAEGCNRWNANGTAVVLCHLSQGHTFVGSIFNKRPWE